MDHLFASQSLCSESIPSRQGTPFQYMMKCTESSHSALSVTDGASLSNHRHQNPCLAIDNWASSGPTSSASMMSCHPQPWVMETSGFTFSSSHSPPHSTPDGLPRFFLAYDGDWSSSSMTSHPTSGQSKPGLPRLNNGRIPTDWMRDPDKNPQYALKPEPSYTTTPETFGPHQRPSTNLTMTYPTTALTPPSPTFSTSSCHMSTGMDKYPSGRVELRITPDDTEAELDTDPPYSILIWKALSQAKGNRLPLQGIYNWFEKNTAKGKDRNSKGWQNSIRHNLSMNAGFEAVRVELEPGKKAVNFWRLTDEALKHGVQSTTRYRKQANYKKTVGSEPPAPQRQRSGAKGGKATKVTARFRGSMSQDELRKERYRQRVVSQRRSPKILQSQHHPSSVTTAVISRLHASGSATSLTRTAESFDLGSIVGSADPPSCNAIFYDMAGPGSDCLAMETGFLGWTSLPPFSHSLLAGPDVSTELPLAV
ncbi:hypothetical protein BDV25DRAFT_170428 [Aspergillus avenaceus]|uniref:Fork-head domain-containing protein n=1 Tax=Aspergillus avenaceus TaxID=36643 RepID=A0A5N6TGS9_ASPAV|nr:hypothetical protein BDV25DRAFT_170428 [Aspergillus avenaceus]